MHLALYTIPVHSEPCSHGGLVACSAVRGVAKEPIRFGLVVAIVIYVLVPRFTS